MTSTRINEPLKLAPATMKALAGAEAAIAASGLDNNLLELVRLRASQMNGCAYCIHHHATLLRKAGEPEMRLYLLDGWREATVYLPKERAALAWTEALTKVADTHAPDADYAELEEHFSEAERVQLTLAIGVINVWNRVQIAFRVTNPE